MPVKDTRRMGVGLMRLWARRRRGSTAAGPAAGRPAVSTTTATASVEREDEHAYA